MAFLRLRASYIDSDVRISVAVIAVIDEVNDPHVSDLIYKKSTTLAFIPRLGGSQPAEAKGAVVYAVASSF